jgi:hypothetical protein
MQQDRCSARIDEEGLPEELIPKNPSTRRPALMSSGRLLQLGPRPRSGLWDVAEACVECPLCCARYQSGLTRLTVSVNFFKQGFGEVQPP